MVELLAARDAAGLRAPTLIAHLMHKRDAVLELMKKGQLGAQGRRRSMNAPPPARAAPIATNWRAGLRRETEGEVLFDIVARPLRHRCLDLPAAAVGVFVPKTQRDVAIACRSRANSARRCCRAAAAPRSAARPPARRWSSTSASTCGACSLDVEALRAEVEPGRCSTTSTPS